MTTDRRNINKLTSAGEKQDGEDVKWQLKHSYVCTYVRGYKQKRCVRL